MLPDGLPRLPQGALSQLRRHGYLTTTQAGTYLVLHAIGANGGRPIRITENGTIADDLPRIAIPVIGHLRVNRLLSNQRDGDGWQTGYGSRVQAVAAHWKIQLPDPTATE